MTAPAEVAPALPPAATPATRPAGPRGAAPKPTRDAPVRPIFDEEGESGGTQPWRRVRWSVLFVTFLAYVFVATTSRIPIGKAAMAAALVGLLIEGGSIRVPRFLLWLGGFVLWASVGLAGTSFFELSFEKVIDMAKVWLIALAAVNALTSRPRIRLYIIVFAGFFAIYPVRGTIINYLSGNVYFGRAAWLHIFENPNDLAAMSLLQLSMVAGLLASGVKGWLRWVSVGGIVALPLVILVTQSRGALVASGVFLIALAWSQRRRIKPSTVLKALPLVAVLLYFAPKGVWNRLEGLRHATDTSRLSEVDAEGSARQRFEIWKIATKVFVDHPVVGVGLGVYHKVHEQYALSEEFDPIGRGDRDTHSTYLRLLAETGVVGFALFVGLIASVVTFSERVRRRARTLLPGSAQQLLYLELGLLAFFIAGIWGTYAHLAFTYLHLALIWGLADVTRRDLDRLSSMTPARTAHGRSR